MNEIDDNLTCFATNCNKCQSISEQMDALEQLYSLKNLQRRDRKISKAKSQMLGSVKITHLSEIQALDYSFGDFIPMTYQSDGQVVSWDFLALLQSYKNMFIIGVVGKREEIQNLIHKLTGEVMDMPDDYNDCLYFSRKWTWPQNTRVNWCFLIRYTEKRVQSDSTINDVMFTIVPHMIVVFESLPYNVEIVLNNCKKYHYMVQTITKVEQSLFVRAVKDHFFFPESQLFLESYFGTQHSSPISFLGQNLQELQGLIHRNIKRNFQIIITNEPVILYYLVISIWTHMRRILQQSSQIKSLNISNLTHIYLEVLEKELRYEYKVRSEHYIKESTDEFFLSQCLKQQKQHCLNKFVKYSAFCKVQKSKTYEKFCEFIRQSEIEIHKWNQQTNYKRNLELAYHAAQNITYKLSKSMYKSSDQDLFHRDFCEFLGNYEKNCIGVTSGQALFRLLQDFIPSVYNYFDLTTKHQIKQIVQNRQIQESKDDIHQRIAMTQNILSTLERDIIEIENKRLFIEKKRKNLEVEVIRTKQVLRQTRQKIHNASNTKKSLKNMQQYTPRKSKSQLKEKQNRRRRSKRCLIF